jgi:methionyl-tRNA formyltransferase
VRIVFFGTPDSAVVSFEALIDAGHDVAGVVTQPDRPSGRSRKEQPPPLKIAAQRRSIAVAQPARPRLDDLQQLEQGSPAEAYVVVAYGRLLGSAILAQPPKGAINLHFSLLPRYRGAAPVQWALASGESLTGVTTMQMNERLDEGDILLQRELVILDGEHAPSLERRLSVIGAEVLVQTLSRMAAGTLVGRPQQHEHATFAPRISARDGLLDLRMTAVEIEGRVRGFDPWPGAWIVHKGRRMRLARARALGQRDEDAGSPGRVAGQVPEGILLVCGQGSLLLVEQIQPEGRRTMSSRDAVHGRHIEPGDQVELVAHER